MRESIPRDAKVAQHGQETLFVEDAEFAERAVRRATQGFLRIDIGGSRPAEEILIKGRYDPTSFLES